MEEILLKNGEKVSVRLLDAGDYEAFCDFFDKLAKETVFTNQYVGRPRQIKEAFLQQLNGENSNRLVVLNKNNEIVGSCSVIIERPDHPWLCRSCDFGIMILEQYTGQGLGTFLMQKIEDWARLKHIHRIGAEVRTKNVAAINLYLKCGFEIEGTKKDVAFINGEWHSQYCIGKILD